MSVALAVQEYQTEWEQRAADAVEELVKGPNGGCWPVTLTQLRRVAGSYGRKVRIQTECSLFPGLLADELILVYDNGDEQEVFARIVHEVAEYLLTSEHRPPMQFPEDRGTAHRIARMVDGEYRVYLLFHKQMEEILTERKRKRKRMDGELVYEPMFE